MASQNSHSSGSARTKFVVLKTVDYLEVHPPAPNSFTLRERLLQGLFPLKMRLFISTFIIVLMFIMLWMSYTVIGFNPLIVMGLMVIPFLLLWIFTSTRSTHLYFDRKADQFEIRLRSLEVPHREIVQTKDRISEIQQVAVFEKYQGKDCTGRTITIQTRQTYALDWHLTKAESSWIVNEIRSWLLLQ
ncbi:hypothetical protein H6G89_28880 [Oscillatoria sp. FACHB-1407]|uniref:hypothetical protein n=1 Tax=Oscillatoria sp. FACHB-1407 TaxID=2692847 RepID=UPI001682C6A9|nr:hypothetical protein [Oscillatoria sp. FACHB-1407]MBD2465025.1 hypothetical protein [Oscillatoria sp. FACHB-1407]